MDTGKLKKFAQAARQDLIQQVAGKLEQVLAEGSLAQREQAGTVADLERQIQAHGREEVIERAAYTWFNRFTALRFMDAKGYNQIMVVSPAERQSQPAILAEAKQGHIDERVVPEKIRERVFALLHGRTPSRDAQGEAYRLLLVAVCNYWHQAMPFLFERIADWTELLMPNDLLSDSSVRTRIRTVLNAEDCQDVEVIGWLYQFYISERKAEVFAGLKKNQRITPENIAAATQLFTPHWIVRYLVENSLGRLWLLNRPQSKLAERMDYYIAPEEPETDFLKINNPEHIRICDPACGSGHMLTYAFDMLHAIYEEEGYDPAEIPGRILQNNLYGIEIDDRAGALAAFALMMKAAERLGRRKFLRLDVQPNICVLQNVTFREDELNDYMAEVGRDLFTAELRETLGQFEQAKNFGSLIQPALKDPAEVRRVLASKNLGGNLFLSGTHQRVVDVLRMAEFLAPKFHVVVANPPYMGGKGMNEFLQDFTKKQYPNGKSDLFAAFIFRGLGLVVSGGFSAMVTMESWMFLASFEKLRSSLLHETTIQSMVHMPYLGKGGTSMGINFGTTAFVCIKNPNAEFHGTFCCVRYFETDDEGIPREFPPKNERFATASSKDFKKVPGSPIAYWVSEPARKAYISGESIGATCYGQPGLQTSDNDTFIRLWPEVESRNTALGCESSEMAESSGLKWFPYLKGGDFRKWFGNHEYVVNWQNNGADIKKYVATKYPYLNGNIDYVVKDRGYYFRELISYTKITSAKFNARTSGSGFLFDVAGSSIFPDHADRESVLGFLNSKVCDIFLRAQNPTMNIQSGDIDNLPYVGKWVADAKSKIDTAISSSVDLARLDWDAYESSWDFTTPPLLSPDHRAKTVEATYTHVRTRWRAMTDEMQRLEEENNRIFIDAYGLQDELTPDVPLEEITLTCNPAHRYGGNLSDTEREQRLLSDTMSEFLSYAVGCLFGRYSLDKPGLVLANQGETLADYLARVPQPTFMPDDDNVIPVLDDAWFSDDIVERVHQFLRLTFGTAQFQENLAFIESALGKPLRKYFVKDFYKHHVQRYKKRPIYWLFSSPKGSFNALIYMHRYRSDTGSVILNDYLREFRTKLAARVQQLEEIEASTSSSARDKTAALKEIAKLRDTIAELEDWERKVMLPLASERIEIDLDDGVKANYAKFGSALAKVPGLSA